MKANLVAIKDCVVKAKTWNPVVEAKDETITYIDIAAVDKDLKKIVEPTLCLGAEAPSRARQLVQTNDVLVSTVRPNLNSVAVVTEEFSGATASTGYTVLRPLPEVLDTQYLFHWVKTGHFINEMIKLATGQSYPAVSDKIILNSKIPLPPLAEQRRIASILDQADELRQKRQQAIEKLDQLLQATFIDMFGDPVSNPKGWEKKKIKQVLTKLTDGTHHSPPAMDEGIPYITAKHIKEGFIDFYSKPTFVSIEDHKAIYSRCDPIQGDVLYIKDGATTGIASINYFDFEFSLLSSVALLRPNPKLLTSDYLESWLNHKTVKQNILQNMGGAAIKRLTLAKIKDLDILVPNLENQNIFSKVKRQIYIQRQILERSFNIQNDLFQSLQNQAFNGTL
ncbi:restriction endonuclease subunit S [Acinetobacter faecalis]|uniref:restriction endonuclease subunit S n=1 Tax=Acinetobacter faecalis TaxID=2665161 RepID=UPI002A912A35|nr:restriction endonuclease subunit S [Acinetobacter faecalis]MDY6468298.1 restriction endonuclease subunit S [Acinetobacter faecalis]